MRTNVTLDESLVAELQRLSGHRTKTAAVVFAIEQQIRRTKRDQLIALLGNVPVDEKALARARRADRDRDRKVGHR